MELVTGISDIQAGAEKIKRDFGISLVFATLGPNGSMALYKDMVVKKEGYLNPDTIETTGAGDTFCASAINYVLDHPIDDLSEKDLENMLRFANAAAYIVTTKKGAIRSMPDPEDVQEILNRN